LDPNGKNFALLPKDPNSTFCTILACGQLLAVAMLCRTNFKYCQTSKFVWCAVHECHGFFFLKMSHHVIELKIRCFASG
jgi:hypothetical protein